MKSQTQHAHTNDSKQTSTKIYCHLGNVKAAEQLLKSLRPYDAVFVPVDGSGAVKLSEAGKTGATVLILTEPVEYTLARALHVRGDLEQTFNDWYLCIQSLRDVACAATGQVHILFTTNINEVAAELGRLELVEPDGELLSLSALPQVDPLMLLAAEALIARDRDVMALAKEVNSPAQIASTQIHFSNPQKARTSTLCEQAEIQMELDATIAHLLRVQESELVQTRIVKELRAEVARLKDGLQLRVQPPIEITGMHSKQEGFPLKLAAAGMRRKISGKTVRLVLSAVVFYRLAQWRLFSQRRRDKLLRSACKRDPFLMLQVKEAKRSEISDKKIAELEAELDRTRRNAVNHEEERDKLSYDKLSYKEGLDRTRKQLAKLENDHRKALIRTHTLEENANELNREIKRLRAVQAGLEVELDRAEAQVLILKEIFKLPFESRG